MNEEIISRTDARARGLTHYFTGKPCPHGHVTRRRVNDKHCLECVRLSTMKFRTDNPRRWKELRAKYHSENRESDNLKSRQWRKKNPERDRENHINWRAANPERAYLICKAYKHRRAARKKAAAGSFTSQQIAELLIKQKHRCAGPLCKISIREGFDIDHIIPLSRGGTNYIHNIQLLCPTCNGRKHAKDPIEWAQQNGLLL